MLSLIELGQLLEQAKAGRDDSHKALFKFFYSVELDDYLKQAKSKWETQKLFLNVREFALLQDKESVGFQAWQYLFNFTLAHQYAALGDLKSIQELAHSNPALLRQRDNWGITPLYDAIRHDRTEVEFFYEQNLLCKPDSATRVSVHSATQQIGAPKEQVEAAYFSLLHTLARWGDVDVIQKIKQRHKINLLCSDNDGDWPIHCALDNQEAEVLALLYDPIMRTIPHRDGHYLMYRAVLPPENPRSIEILKILTDLGEDPNQTTDIGFTALSHVLFSTSEHEPDPTESLHERFRMAKALLDIGSDINLMSSYGCRTIQHTSSFTYPITELDLATGKEITREVTVNFPNPTSLAAPFSPMTMKTGRELTGADGSSILPMGLPVEFFQPIVTLENQTLLHLCIKSFPKNPSKEPQKVKYYFEIARFLFNNGIDPDIKNSEGKTALQLAESLNFPGFVHLLTAYQTKDDARKEKIQAAIAGSASIGGHTSLVMQYLYTRHSDKEAGKTKTDVTLVKQKLEV